MSTLFVCITCRREGDPPAVADDVPQRGFGDRNDPDSDISKVIERESRRAFKLLDFLGTQPAIYYLKGGTSHA